MLNNKLTIYSSEPFDVQFTPQTSVSVVIHGRNADPSPLKKFTPGMWFQTPEGSLKPIDGQDRYFYVTNTTGKIKRNILQMLKFSAHLTVIYSIGLYFWLKKRFI